MKPLMKTWEIRLDLISYAAVSSLFIMAFLALFRPFDINIAPTRTVIISVPMIGTIHFVYLVIYTRLIHYFRDTTGMSRVTEFYWLLGFVTITAITTKTVHVMLDLSVSNAQENFEWMYGSFLVMPIPHFVRLFLYKETILNLSFPGGNPHINDPLFERLDMNKLCFVKAMENYVSVAWDNNGKLEKTLLRSTMTRLEKSLMDSRMVRCHRSYIINTACDIDIRGNSRLYYLVLQTHGQQFEIPLSNKKYSEVRSKLLKTD